MIFIKITLNTKLFYNIIIIYFVFVIEQKLLKLKKYIYKDISILTIKNKNKIINIKYRKNKKKFLFNI